MHDALANQGVEVEGDENVQQRERTFYSRETTTAYYPRLVVTYRVTNDSQPPDITVDPLPAFSRRQFTVSWSGVDQGSSGIGFYDVQYQVDGGAWTDWQLNVTYNSAEFVGVTGHTYGFRARGVDRAGNVEAYGAVEAQTEVDNHAPVVTVDPLPPEVGTTPFTVTWSGSDDVSGLYDYDVRYRFSGGPWVNWQVHTLSTSAQFQAMDDGVYEFEARGTDNAGNIEQFTGHAEATTARDAEAPFLEPVMWLPLIFR